MCVVKQISEWNTFIVQSGLFTVKYTCFSIFLNQNSSEEFFLQNYCIICLLCDLILSLVGSLHRCKADIEELKERLAESEMEQGRLRGETLEVVLKLNKTKENLHLSELEQFRLHQEKVALDQEKVALHQEKVAAEKFLESKIEDLTQVCVQRVYTKIAGKVLLRSIGQVILAFDGQFNWQVYKPATVDLIQHVWDFREAKFLEIPDYRVISSVIAKRTWGSAVS